MKKYYDLFGEVLVNENFNKKGSKMLKSKSDVYFVLLMYQAAALIVGEGDLTKLEPCFHYDTNLVKTHHLKKLDSTCWVRKKIPGFPTVTKINRWMIFRKIWIKYKMCNRLYFLQS